MKEFPNRLKDLPTDEGIKQMACFNPLHLFNLLGILLGIN